MDKFVAQGGLVPLADHHFLKTSLEKKKKKKKRRFELLVIWKKKKKKIKI